MKLTSNTDWMIPRRDLPRIILSSGEPAGIGPDLVIGLQQSGKSIKHLTVVGDPALLQQRAGKLNADVPFIPVSAGEQQTRTDAVHILPVALKQPVVAGELNHANADYVLNMLAMAAQACLRGQYDALVTGPVQKSTINEAGIPFTGHTEFLAEQCGTGLPVMLLCCPQLRVALVTTHLPLRDVAAAITAERLSATLEIIHRDMRRRFGLSRPRITVCGLNPHAGEEGHLGHEEQAIIDPVLETLRQQGMCLLGPVAADTAFREDVRRETDVFACMYHDQGLPVLKGLGFGEAVNVTLGLPIIRTSVDHGTALSLAGTGKARADSLMAAIELAETLARHQSTGNHA